MGYALEVVERTSGAGVEGKYVGRAEEYGIGMELEVDVQGGVDDGERNGWEG